MGKPGSTATTGGKSYAPTDTCHIPAPPAPAGPGGIPTPFPNRGDVSSSNAATQKVLFNKKGVLVENSQVPGSSGDEAGTSNLPTPKGLMSQKNQGKVRFKSQSSKVKAEGASAVQAGSQSEEAGEPWWAADECESESTSEAAPEAETTVPGASTEPPQAKILI